MASRYLLALDQGTTSSRAILFDEDGTIVHLAQKEFKQYFPEPGWVEHDPEEIWATQYGVMMEVMAKAKATPHQIAAIGITNQRETTIVWDKQTGKPVYNAIVWQDRRTSGYCDRLRDAGNTEMIRNKTGLVIDAYFSATKLKWILDHVPEARLKAAKGQLAFGTVDSWLVWKLTGGKLHVTDASNASRTMLLNIHEVAWDNELLQLFDIPSAVLPEVVPSSALYGVTDPALLNGSIQIAGIAGDQQAALFGQMCTRPGMVKNTYGTGCFMLMNTGTKPVRSTNNLLTTIAWKTGNETVYALEGSVFIAGAVVQWLRDGMELFRQSSEVEQLAGLVTDTGGVYMVPAFAGLGAPHWNPYARGSIFGITRGTTKAHMARAALESIAYQTLDVLKSMIADADIPITELRVDGGATINNLLMQFQSDLLQTPVVRPKVYETTALGAAYLAGMASGFWPSGEALQKQWKADARFEPSLSKEKVDSLISGWERAVKASIAWAEDR